MSINQIKKIINEELEIILVENFQLADKLYFKTGKLNEDDKNIILSITNGDYTTKLISDLYLQVKGSYFSGQEVTKGLTNAHNQLINYNQNFFPIKDFDIYNKNNSIEFWTFDYRGKILTEIKQLPSVAIRNLRNEIRIPRNTKEFQNYEHYLEYFLAQYSQLSNREPELKKRIEQKMFKSNITLSQLIDFAEEKENMLGGKDFTRESIENLVKENPYDLNIVYQNSNAMVIEISSLEGIKEIGCNSLWCFTYGKDNYNQWHNYSYNGIVYAIIDFREQSDSPNFIHVLIQPLAPKYTEDNEDQSPLFNMANESQYDPYYILNSILGKMNYKKLFTF